MFFFYSEITQSGAFVLGKLICHLKRNVTCSIIFNQTLRLCYITDKSATRELNVNNS